MEIAKERRGGGRGGDGGGGAIVMTIVEHFIDGGNPCDSDGMHVCAYVYVWGIHL